MTKPFPLNFWQILGLILVLVGVSYLIYSKTGVKPANPIEPAAPPPIVQPTTTPA